MSSTLPSSSVPIACSLKRTLSWAIRRRCISAMYSLALADWRPRPITVRSAVATASTLTPVDLGQSAVAQERRRPVALLVIAIPKPVHRGEDVVEAHVTAQLDRSLRPVESELDSVVDVVSRADAFAQGEDGLVDDAGLDALQQVQFGGVAELRVARVVGAVRAVAVLVPAAAGLPPQPARGDHLGLQRAGPPARLPERQLHERLRHGEAHVDADQVHQLEW